MNEKVQTKVVRPFMCVNCDLSSKEGVQRHCMFGPPQVTPFVGEVRHKLTGEVKPVVLGGDVRFIPVNDEMWCAQHPQLQKRLRDGYEGELNPGTVVPVPSVVKKNAIIGV